MEAWRLATKWMQLSSDHLQGIYVSQSIFAISPSNLHDTFLCHTSLSVKVWAPAIQWTAADALVLKPRRA